MRTNGCLNGLVSRFIQIVFLFSFFPEWEAGQCICACLLDLCPAKFAWMMQTGYTSQDQECSLTSFSADSHSGSAKLPDKKLGLVGRQNRHHMNGAGAGRHITLYNQPLISSADFLHSIPSPHSSSVYLLTKGGSFVKIAPFCTAAFSSIFWAIALSVLIYSLA